LEEVQRLMLERTATTLFARRFPGVRDFVAGGKMLRADLVLRLARVLGREREFAVRLAAAVELIHAASLVHDDILDGAELRRGSPAMWRLMGIPQAVLFGDTLFFIALGLLAECGGNLTGRMAAVGRDTCEGEYQQELQGREDTSGWDAYCRMARLKTGSLFAFASAAVVPGEDAGLRCALEESGYDLGLAYQIMDDFMDVLGDCSITGKTGGLDARLGGATAPAALAVRGGSGHAEVERLLDRASRRLEPWPRVCRTWEAYVAERIGPLISLTAQMESRER